jgi:predicted metal-binding membrane protein
MTHTQPRSPVRTLPRRDRIAILAALAGLTVLAWLYLLDMNLAMGNAIRQVRPCSA